MSASVLLRFDRSLGVLSAHLADAHVVRARPSKIDNCLVLELDASGRVVGVEILEPTAMPSSAWYEHSDRHQLPATLRAEVDAWLEEMWAHMAARVHEGPTKGR